MEYTNTKCRAVERQVINLRLTKKEIKMWLNTIFNPDLITQLPIIQCLNS